MGHTIVYQVGRQGNPFGGYGDMCQGSYRLLVDHFSLPFHRDSFGSEPDEASRSIHQQFLVLPFPLVIFLFPLPDDVLVLSVGLFAAKNGADCYSKNGDAVTVLTWQS